MAPCAVKAPPLTRLKKDLPLDWEAQRKTFGLAAQTR
jgi:hypothetical protein